MPEGFPAEWWFQGGAMAQGVIICVKGIAGGVLVQRVLQGRVCIAGRLFAYGGVCAAGFAGPLSA